MKRIEKPKNLTEYAFKQWANSPKSAHPEDKKRFYKFVKTMKRYRCKKYLNYQYFKEQLINTENSILDEEDINYYYDKMKEFLEYDQCYAYSDYDFLLNNIENS